MSGNNQSNNNGVKAYNTGTSTKSQKITTPHKQCTQQYHKSAMKRQYHTQNYHKDSAVIDSAVDQAITTIDSVMDAEMSDIPEDGVLDKILIFRENALDLEDRMLSRKEGTLGAILVVGQADSSYGDFTDFKQVSGLESIAPATKTVKHVMKNVTLTGLGSNELDINALTLVNLNDTHEFDEIALINAQDDGIEIFGGSVNMSNITVQDAVDDYFDTDHAHTGTITNLNLIQTDSTKGKSLIECGNSNGTTATKFVYLTYNGGYDVSSYQNNGSVKNFNIKSGSVVTINGETFTSGIDKLP